MRKQAVLSMGTVIELFEDLIKLREDPLIEKIWPLMEKNPHDICSQLNYVMLLFSTGKVIYMWGENSCQENIRFNSDLSALTDLFLWQTIQWCELILWYMLIRGNVELKNSVCYYSLSLSLSDTVKVGYDRAFFCSYGLFRPIYFASHPSPVVGSRWAIRNHEHR